MPTYSGYVYPSFEDDYYTIELVAGRQYIFDLERLDVTGNELDPELFLYGPSGIQLASDDSNGGGLNARIIYAATISGTFTLQASSYQGLTTGAYGLTGFEDD